MEEQVFALIKTLVEKEINTSFLSLEKCADYYSINYDSKLFCRIKLSKKLQYLAFKERYRNLFEGFHITQVSSAMEFIRVGFSDLHDIELMKEALIIILKEFPVPYTFDVCSRYEQCSDALMCLHPDPQHARECSYKKKLERGIVFFGKNRSID